MTSNAIIAIASANTKENIMDNNILEAADGLRPRALTAPYPTKAITKDGPRVVKNSIKIRLKVLML